MGKIQIMNSKRLLSSIIITSLYILVLSPLHAGIYKWTDENGQVHYGERPGNTGAEKVTIRTNETTKPRTINKDEEEIDESDKKDTEQQAEEAGKPVEIPPTNKEKRRYCNEAKQDLAAISGRGRMREIDSTGNYSYLTEEQRQQRIATAQKKKRKYCH